MIEVSGRLYPVEVRYRPVGGDSEDTTRDEEEAALADAVDELCREGPGDILVFLPGERGPCTREATHYGWELSQEPKQRELELLREYVDRHRSYPRCNEKR